MQVVDDNEDRKGREWVFRQTRSASSSASAASTSVVPPGGDGASAASPELCDDAISKLDVTRTRVQRYRSQYLAEESWAKKVGNFLGATWNGTAWLLQYLAALPGKIYTFYFKTSSQERRAVYADWWAHTKKEAYHYWVCDAAPCCSNVAEHHTTEQWQVHLHIKLAADNCVGRNHVA